MGNGQASYVSVYHSFLWMGQPDWRHGLRKKWKYISTSKILPLLLGFIDMFRISDFLLLLNITRTHHGIDIPASQTTKARRRLKAIGM